MKIYFSFLLFFIKIRVDHMLTMLVQILVHFLYMSNLTYQAYQTLLIDSCLNLFFLSYICRVHYPDFHIGILS